jgi:hypothetical protein
MRVIVTALAFCTLSFLAGVAGDLSVASQFETVAARPAYARVELPPHLANAVRARPLTATSAAEAAPMRRASARAEAIAPADKPAAESEKASRKSRPAAKPAGAKG